MRNSKFIVVKLRELIKTIIFAVLGVIILIGLITFFLRMGNDAQTSMYRDGTYEATLDLGRECAAIEVEIQDGRIAGLDMTQSNESVAVMYPMAQTALKEIGEQVVQTQSTADMDISKQHTYTAKVLLAAIEDCLEQAKR